MNRLYVLILFMLTSVICLSQTIDRITSVEAVDFLKKRNKNTSVIIDGRDSTKYYSGHIKDADYVDAFDANAKTKLEKYLGYDTIFVYCTMNKRSEKIIEILQQLTFGGIITNMTDGINGWVENGYEIEKNDNGIIKLGQ